LKKSFKQVVKMRENLVTIVSSERREVKISSDGPTVIIGERINPTGKKRLAKALLTGDMGLVREEAIAQVEAGAEIIDVNVGAAGVDEPKLLPLAVEAVMDAVDVPISIDTSNFEALKAALEVYKGKALVNSTSGEKASLERVLPLVKEHGAVVIGLTMDEGGIPEDPIRRLEIAERILSCAEGYGIPKEDVIIDCLATSVGADYKAGLKTLEAIELVKRELGVNQTIGASNISFGLPERDFINSAFLAMAIACGVTCPILDPIKNGFLILAINLLLGRDEYAMRYIRCYRKKIRIHTNRGTTTQPLIA
jgi:5-methyltetrahydrofolate--homocysteine methyltransferase